ncbi:MAG: enoyl-CoA hydratase/isomerase family protein [Deltaproteobacteria bacterium]|nr:enoyl-CoA hydratase/isomerase family protein [Deltaproteobacteria bacterium]
MDYKYLKVERLQEIATVTMNRPEKGNMLSMEMMNELVQVAEEFQDDLKTRVVIFTGAGKSFCMGVDLNDSGHIETAAGPLLARQRKFSAGPRMIRALYSMSQITIAAINGVAQGGGACIASAMDFRIGADNCKIAYPEVNIAIPLSWVGLPLCVHLVGPSRAKHFVILGRRENAETLLNWGFLDDVVSPDNLMEHANEMAEAYAAKAPIPTQMIKRSINAITSSMDEAIMHMDTDQVLLAQSTRDFEEGVKAVFEKRKPEFKGE